MGLTGQSRQGGDRSCDELLSGRDRQRQNSGMCGTFLHIFGQACVCYVRKYVTPADASNLTQQGAWIPSPLERNFLLASQRHSRKTRTLTIAHPFRRHHRSNHQFLQISAKENTDIMRPSALVFAALAIFSTAVAVDVRKSVIITYPPETPDSVLDQAKRAIEDGGGIITHEYQLIKYARAPSNPLELGRRLLTSLQGLRC